MRYKLFKYGIAWAPFFINLYYIADTDILGIFLIPVSLILGAAILAGWDTIEMEDMDKSSDEYKKLKNERDTALGSAIGGVFYGLHETKNSIKELSDPDKWTTKL